MYKDLLILGSIIVAIYYLMPAILVIVGYMIVFSPIFIAYKVVKALLRRASV